MRKRSLFEHQRLGLYYVQRTRNPALLWEMRLGKTLVTIRGARLQCGKELRALVVAPLSVLGAWEKELASEGESDFQRLVGTRAERLKLLSNLKTWNLINKEGYRVLPEIADQPWTTVIVDESVCLKNPKAAVTKFFLKNFRRVKHRWILSGLPNPESDLDLWTQFAFLHGRAFGFNSYWGFRLTMFEQIYNDWRPKPGTPTVIARHVAKLSSILKRKDVHMDCTKLYQVHETTLSDEARAVYDDAETKYVLQLDEGKVEINFAGAQHTYLRQLANGWAGNRFLSDHKVQCVMNLLGELLKDEPVVIWFAFNQDIEALSIALDTQNVAYRILTGDTTPFDRDAYIKEFQNGRVRILLVQIAIGQYGIDLSVADTAIFYSNSYSHDQRAQAEDRIVHPAKKTPLLYIDIKAVNTVDADVYDAIVQKRVASQATLNRVLRVLLEQRRKGAVCHAS